MMRDARGALWTAIAAACRAIAGPVLPLPLSRSLRCCPECGRDRIAVVESSLSGPGPARLRLRCGDCGSGWDMVATMSQARALLALHATQRRELEEALAVADPAITRELDALLVRHSPVPRNQEPR